MTPPLSICCNAESKPMPHEGDGGHMVCKNCNRQFVEKRESKNWWEERPFLLMAHIGGVTKDSPLAADICEEIAPIIRCIISEAISRRDAQWREGLEGMKDRIKGKESGCKKCDSWKEYFSHHDTDYFCERCGAQITTREFDRLDYSEKK